MGSGRRHCGSAALGAQPEGGQTNDTRISQALEHLTAAVQQRRRLRTVLFRTGYTSAMLSLAAAQVLGQPWASASLALAFLLPMSCCAVYIATCSSGPEHLFRDVLGGSSLADLAHLAQAEGAGSAPVRARAQRRLTGLLPVISESDSLALGPRARLHLRQCLDAAADAGQTRFDSAFLCAAIAALVRVQDYESYPEVNRLARLSSSPSLRDAAAVGAARLRTIAERKGQFGGLLRPADAPAADTLLRPATGAQRGETEHLLRATSVEEGPDEARQDATD